MVLKEVTVYFFCNNFANNRSTVLKFWHIMGTYGGHLWCEFQWAATSFVEFTMFLCTFDTQPNLLIGGHNGPAGAQWVEKFEI